MKRWSLPLLLLAVAGCRGPRTFSAPAPANALECALREAQEIGYVRLEGQAESGVVRIGKRTAPPPGREVTDPEVRLSDITGPRLRTGEFESMLRVSMRRGQLRIAVLSLPDPEGAAGAPGVDSPTGDAQEILVQCSSPQSR